MPDWIRIRGARQNNLKNIDVDLPKHKLVVVTGPSGAGKSSLAFDTLYAEGQRRYVEALSTGARQYLTQLDKPDVDRVEGLSPAIAVEQRPGPPNPRSTVGTVSEIYDFLRLLYARVGEPVCYRCGRPIRGYRVQEMVDTALARAPARLLVCAPLVYSPQLDFRDQLQRLRKGGFVRVRVNGTLYALEDDVPQPVLPTDEGSTAGAAWPLSIVVDRVALAGADRQRLTEAVELALHHGQGLVALVFLADSGEEEALLSQAPRCLPCGITYPEPQPRLFSFNSPHGACPECHGLGTVLEPDLSRVVPAPGKSLAEGAVAPWETRNSEAFRHVLEQVATHYNFSIFTAFEKLAPRQRELVLHGSGAEELSFTYRNEGDVREHRYSRPFEGVLPYLARRLRETESPAVRTDLRQYFSEHVCAACAGKRLRPEAAHVRIAGQDIAHVTHLPLDSARDWVQGLRLPGATGEIAASILPEIEARLGFLLGVGLHYLTLDRTMDTLSNGETQRIRLATQIGTALSGVIYILDEPTIGLHQRDTARLLETLRGLRDAGNTVVVVEHDRETMLAADHLIEIGPRAGEAGGYLVASGTAEELRANPNSGTGAWLSGARHMALPPPRALHGPRLELLGAHANNLQQVDVAIPLGALVCVTGVSGSGKSSLVLDTLYPALKRLLGPSGRISGPLRELRGAQHLTRVVHVDQSPVGKSSRSNPATFLGLFTLIREQFTAQTEARVRGYTPRRFSFNAEGGRCEACRGEGQRRVEMHFLPDVFVRCDVCAGARYNRETLEVHIRGKSIADVLNFTFSEAEAFFRNMPAIQSRLPALLDMGLGYLRLGQPAATLSGGEAQRLKIARDLGRPGTGPTLYILDEPTTGLHFEDVERLLGVLGQLVAAGHSVVVIEHNLEFIRCADYVIDLGPEGGAAGGRVVAQGTPPELAQQAAESHTAAWLASLLSGAPAKNSARG